jgi:hypothetical protein
VTGEEIRRLLAELDGITGDDWLIRGDELANANSKAIRRDELAEAVRSEADRWVDSHRGRLLSHREGAGRLHVYYEIPLKELWPPDPPPASRA